MIGEDFNAVKCEGERVGRNMIGNNSEWNDFSGFINDIGLEMSCAKAGGLVSLAVTVGPKVVSTGFWCPKILWIGGGLRDNSLVIEIFRTIAQFELWQTKKIGA